MIDQTTRILNAIYDAIDEINRQLPSAMQLDKAPDTALYAKSGVLDSLGFVNLILTVEETVADEFGMAVNIADKVAARLENNPFRSVSTLAEYIGGLLESQVNARERF